MNWNIIIIKIFASKALSELRLPNLNIVHWTSNSQWDLSRSCLQPDSIWPAEHETALPDIMQSDVLETTNIKISLITRHLPQSRVLDRKFCLSVRNHFILLRKLNILMQITLVCSSARNWPSNAKKQPAPPSTDQVQPNTNHHCFILTQYNQVPINTT